MNQLILHKPNFLIFNYTEYDLEDIRGELYESYESLADEMIPRMEELMNDELPINRIYNEIISELAFDDPYEYEWIIGEDTDIFEAVYNANGWKISNDLEEIMLLDHVCFFDRHYDLRNIPTVKVW